MGRAGEFVRVIFAESDESGWRASSGSKSGGQNQRAYRDSTLAQRGERNSGAGRECFHDAAAQRCFDSGPKRFSNSGQATA